MRYLTKKEEIEILEEVKPIIEKNYRNGSSRVVVDYQEDKVVKIAYDRQGKRQNSNEADLFMYSGANSHMLAEVYARGEFIIVMEKIPNIPDCYEVEDEVWANENQKFRDVYDFLCREHGDTGDNFQMGLRADGSVAAYDYGYVYGEHDHCVSDYLRAILYDEEDGATKVLESAVKDLKRLHFA